MFNDFGINIIFENSTESQVYRTGVDIVTGNNTYCGTAYYDGKNKHRFANPGGIYYLDITPEKYIFLRDGKKCRDLPYNEIFFKKLNNFTPSPKCAKVCRPPNEFICKYMEAIEHWPLCKNSSEEECFRDIKAVVAKGKYTSISKDYHPRKR